MSEETTVPVTDGVPADEPPADEPKRRRGRPSNADYAARGEAPPPRKRPAGRRAPRGAPPRRTAADYTRTVDGWLQASTFVASMRDPVAAEIVDAQRPALAAGIGRYAVRHVWLSDALDRVMSSSDLVEILIPLGGIMIPLMAHWGLLNGTPLQHAAEPYEHAVAARQAAEAAAAAAEAQRQAAEAAAAQAASPAA